MHLVGARGLVRLRPLVPRACQLLDLSFWARPRAMDGSDARVLRNAPYRGNPHALGDVRITAYNSLFVYALPASPASVRASCKILDDRNRDLVHRPGSSYRLGGLGHLRQFISVNRAIARAVQAPASIRKSRATGLRGSRAALLTPNKRIIKGRPFITPSVDMFTIYKSRKILVATICFGKYWFDLLNRLAILIPLSVFVSASFVVTIIGNAFEVP
jgi:hypothetical protein